MRIAPLKIHDLVVLCSPDFGDDVRLAQAIIFANYPIISVGNFARHTPWSHLDNQYTYRRVARPSLLPQEKIVAQRLCPPVLDEAFVPAKTLANELWTVAERIEAVHNSQDLLDPEYQRYATEFAALVIPRPQMLSPLEISDVVASQSRPSQRAANAAALPMLAAWLAKARAKIRSFQKNEVYPSTKDPRNISTLPAEHCLLYSTFTQPFAARLKTQRWYAFGMHPDDVARRVHEIAAAALTLTETDFSRFDGTHSTALYEMELALLLRAYPSSHHATIRRIHSAMTEAPARTNMGVAYAIGGSRLSGAADTSIMNTIDNAFVAYCVFRRMHQTPSEAYKSLGLYGGDDGITPNACSTSYNRVVTDLQLRLKAVCRHPRDGCSFLGRQFPNPMTSPDHLCDLPRQLGKLHVYPGRDRPDAWQTMVDRAAGYLVTDPHTPIISDWCRMVRRLAPPTVQVKDALGHTAYEYRHVIAERPLPPSTVDMVAHACSQLRVSAADLAAYQIHLAHITSIEQLQPLRLPALVVSPGLIVGDDLHVAPRVLGPELPAVVIAPRESKQLSSDSKRQPAGDSTPAHPLARLFPSLTLTQLDALQLDAVGSYSATPMPTAHRVYSAVARMFPLTKMAVDMTAGVGSCTLALASHFNVVSIERDAKRAAMAEHNVGVVRSTNPSMRPVTHHVGDSVTWLRACPLGESRIVVIDPPWGGPDRDKALDHTISLSGKPIRALIQSALNRTDTAAVILKLPSRFPDVELQSSGAHFHCFKEGGIKFVCATLVPGPNPWHGMKPAPRIGGNTKPVRHSSKPAAP